MKYHLRQRRTDLLSKLKRGDQKKLARKCNCAPCTVSSILNGYCGQNTDLARKILRCAQQLGRAANIDNPETVVIGALKVGYKLKIE